MPRKRKPPHLFVRTERRQNGETQRVWIIKDGELQRRTGCTEDEIGKAEKCLAEYIAEKYRPKRENAKSSEISIADILNIYLDFKLAKSPRPRELIASIGRLNDYWGEKPVSEILAPACRCYAEKRGTPSGARRDLENLRAAVKHYKAEFGLQAEPVFTLPDKSLPRQRWLTRDEIAKLLWVCYRGDKKSQNKRKHLVRFILIGVYTATRHDAILRLQWLPNTTGGWVDIENAVMYRRAFNKAETKKRTPPIRIPRRLLAHLKRWYKIDGAVRYVVNFNGHEIGRLEKSFRSARKAAGLDDGVIPHALRHTAITWLMQAGVPISEVSGFAGVTVEELERTYFHHHPDYQMDIVNTRLGNIK